MYLIDSHCHFNLINININSINDILDKSYTNGIKKFINISVNINDNNNLFKLSQSYQKIIYYSTGVHPLYIQDNNIIDYKVLLNMSNNEFCVALGETGLDYTSNNINNFNKNLQIKNFISHIKASNITNKPIIIHSRLSDDDTYNILKKYKNINVQGVMHCFTGNWELAKKYLDLNMYISFSGIATFKNASALSDVIKKIPSNRILIETDSPYLSPEPYRGKVNYPYNLLYIAKYISHIRLEKMNTFIYHNYNNNYSLFKFGDN